MTINIAKITGTFEGTTIKISVTLEILEDGKVVRRGHFTVRQDTKDTGWKVKLISNLVASAQAIIDEYKAQEASVTGSFPGAAGMEDILTMISEEIKKGLKT